MGNYSLTFDHIVDIIAISGAMIGATLIASNTGMNVYGYVAFLISGVASIKHLYACDVRWSLKFITYFYIIVNVIGIIRY